MEGRKDFAYDHARATLWDWTAVSCTSNQHTITPVAPCYLTLLSHLETQGVQSLYELGLCAHDVQQGEHVIDVHVH